MTDRERLEAMMSGPMVQRTSWQGDQPCPRCGQPLAENGTGAAWCIRSPCGYARHVKRSTEG